MNIYLLWGATIQKLFKNLRIYLIKTIVFPTIVGNPNLT